MILPYVAEPVPASMGEGYPGRFSLNPRLIEWQIALYSFMSYTSMCCRSGLLLYHFFT